MSNLHNGWYREEHWRIFHTVVLPGGVVVILFHLQGAAFSYYELRRQLKRP
jgi:hypothetical protein